MKVEIKKVVEKKMGSVAEVNYIAEIDGKEYYNHYISKKLLGLTGGEKFGIFGDAEDERGVLVEIGTDYKYFAWKDITGINDVSEIQKETQKRINDVSAWKSTLEYKTVQVFSVEV